MLRRPCEAIFRLQLKRRFDMQLAMSLKTRDTVYIRISDKKCDTQLQNNGS